MSRNNTLLNLLKWDDRELFYRDYYYASPAERAEILNRSDVNPDWQADLLRPDDYFFRIAENQFFNPGQNVSFVRHTRYQPLLRHSHDFFEIFYVVSGECAQELDGRKMRLAQGDLCLVAPGVPHAITVFDDSRILNILVRTSTFMDIFLNSVRDKGELSAFFVGNMSSNGHLPYLIIHTDGNEEVLNAILDMYEENLCMDRYSDRIICSMLTILFALLTRNYNERVEVPEGLNGYAQKSGEILNYIMEHLSGVTLESLADELHYSRTYCSRLIKNIFGISFSELVTQIRLQRAMNLLQMTQISVAEIAEMVGYSTSETLIRNFHSHMHITPSQYRAQHR